MEFSISDTFHEGLEGEWNALLDNSPCHVPFTRYEYLETWWQTRGGGEWPADTRLVLVLARREGKLAGVAPLFHATDHQGRPALLFVGSIEVSDYLDLLCPVEDLPEFCRGLLQYLPGAGLPAWESLELYNLIESSPTLPALEQAAASLGWKFQSGRLQHSPLISLPGDWETYLAGIDKKQRHEIRRKLRRAEESPVPVDWYIHSDPAALDSAMDDFMQLMARDPEKAAFLTPMMKEFMHQVTRCAFEKDCLNLAFLQVGGEKAAGYLSFQYLNRLWVYNSGLDPAFREHSPGWVLLANLIQWAIANNFSELDFMRGDEDYKYRFGAVDRFIVRASLSPG
jgi:CelD/BcsL family acetyltransferase involved in cellulose biosynthesis